jgi:hypothetical protein
MKTSNMNIVALAFLVLVTVDPTFAQSTTSGTSNETRTFTISGIVGLAGVEMRGFPGNPLTDSNGNYSAKVPYGWSGTVTPIKQGYTVIPSSRRYENVISDLRANYGCLLSSVNTSIAGTGIDKVVIIPAGQTRPGDFNSTIEDMRVMLHILDSKVSNEPGSIRGILTDFGDIFNGGNQSSQAIYIQGYGILFMKEVNFPVAINTQTQQNKPQQSQEPSGDTIWQQAKEQVLSGGSNVSGNLPASQNQTIQARVEQLKSDIIDVMKQASNIRQIKPDEWIIVNITGLNQSASRMVSTGTTGVMSGYGAGGYGGYSTGGYGGTSGYGAGGYGAGGYGGYSTGGYGGMSGYGAGTYRGYGAGIGGMAYGTENVNRGSNGGSVDPNASIPSVLTLRAKKSDIDTFAKQELDTEAFRKKVEIYTY